MHSEQHRPLPYLSHSGRELGLMLRGTKPLAYFLNVVASEFDANIGPKRTSGPVSGKSPVAFDPERKSMPPQLDTKVGNFAR